MTLSRYGHVPEAYQRFRPRYPENLAPPLAAYCEAGSGTACAVDCGSGTGISTRWLRRALGPAGAVVGVEPDKSMRRIARAMSPPALELRFTAGRGERLPCMTQTVDVLLIALALQWTERETFYAEAARAVRARGTVAVLENDRRWAQSPMLAAYEETLEALSPGYDRSYRAFDVATELRGHAAFDDVTCHEHDWVLRPTADEFIGLARSSSKVQAAVEASGETAVIEALHAITDAHCDGAGHVSVPYRARLTMARRRTSAG